jgi:hypothetical protein
MSIVENCGDQKYAPAKESVVEKFNKEKSCPILKMVKWYTSKGPLVILMNLKTSLMSIAVAARPGEINPYPLIEEPVNT